MKPYISNVVVFEVVFVLSGHYKFAQGEVLRALDTMLKLRNLTLIEKTDTKTALQLWRLLDAKYGDCLTATQIPRGVPIFTYDADFQKFDGLIVMQPNQIA